MTMKRITCLCLAVLLLVPTMLTGCKKKQTQVLSTYTENSGILCETQTVTSAGSKYELTWVNKDRRFVLKDTQSGDEFYSTPQYLVESETIAPVMIEYYKSDAQNLSLLDGFGDCLRYYEDQYEKAEKQARDEQREMTEKEKALKDKLAYSVERIEDGFRATYSFPEAKIAVAVEYVLTHDGILVRVPMDRLQESENKIYEIKLAPYFVSAANGKEDSYLMVPSGGGALIDAKFSGKVKEYYESVYGDDRSEPITLQSRIQSQIYLPVFGANTVITRCDDDDFGEDEKVEQRVGMLGIIEEGVDCAMVYAKSGGEDEALNNAFSCVYASFCIRSKEKVVYNSQGAQKSTGTRYSDEVTSAENLSVRYIPLSANSNEDTSYVGMAKRYRQYLQERGYLTTAAQSAPVLSVNLLGGTQITESLFGVPYQNDVATTTLTEAQKITEELKALVGNSGMLVSLEGFGQGGLAHTEIGGGFKLSGQVGKQSDLDALIAYAKENNIVLSMNYELAQFQNGGSGVQIGQDTAMCISTLKAKISTYQMSTGLENDGGLSWYLLTRGQLVPMMQKAIDAVKEHNMGAVSIGSLGHIQYSDFRETGYAAMYGFSDTVVEMLNKASDSGLTVVAPDANAYAALNADYVTEVPMHSTRFSMLDADIPFYSLVFQGYKPLTSSSINLAVNVEKNFLQAVSTGMGLQFTLCNTLHNSIKFDEDTAFVSSRYEDWDDRIANMVEKSSGLLEMIGNQPIKSYVQKGNLTTTVFENGVTVEVDYSSENMSLKAMAADGIEILSMVYADGSWR